MSFEHYPFEPCKIQWSNLYDEPALISHILQVWRDDGLPPNVPMFITELNIAWNTGESFGIFSVGFGWQILSALFSPPVGDGLYYFHYLAGRPLPRLQQFHGNVRYVQRGHRTTRSNSPLRSSSPAN